MVVPQDSIEERLVHIQTRNCDKETFLSIYGIDLWQKHSEAVDLFKVWAETTLNRRDVWSSTSIDRWGFEMFLQQAHLVPLKKAAIRFAMSVKDFSRLIKAMCEKRLIPTSLLNGQVPGLYPSSLLDDLGRKLPSMKFRYYTSQTGFILDFHNTIRQELGMSVNTIFTQYSDSYSDIYHEESKEVAIDFDILTGEPMGIAHQVWLDFQKPLALSPDACSIVTFALHEKTLKKYCIEKIAKSELKQIREHLTNNY